MNRHSAAGSHKQ